ncbi:hypothetical protein N7539_005666 [Penicillium diatomitis]|uniref:Uncharacterized protein n=1 Tax=Penicillium diatomitis TaxID=2819901 RepID=A0A9W9X7B3_9EURO|nr:uncharacterized protein N7539_005666 [Penicillium diatomitis]KAJ5485678.1 hypothetical protein N7539_005666 [Penicillium diatomitis]
MESRSQAADPISEARTLVTELYSPANQRQPARINEIQARLQDLQRGEYAWQIADALLTGPTTHHRFMGALTFTVKVNVSSQEVDQSMCAQVLRRLITHCVELVAQSEQVMVIRKLASSLVTLFRHSTCQAERVLWQVAASLAHGGYVDEHQAQTVDFGDTLLPTLDTQSVMALLFLSVALAETTSRLDDEPVDLSGPALKRAMTNTRDGFVLVQYVLGRMSEMGAGTLDDQVRQNLASETMGSWKAWLGVISSRSLPEGENIHALAISCGHTVIQTLRLPGLNEIAASTLTSVIDSRRPAFDDASMWSLSQILADSVVKSHLTSLAEGDEAPESLAFVDLLVAFLSHLQLKLFDEPISPEHAKILVLAHDILKAPGYAVIDDPATPRILEFWNEIAERLLDEVDSDGSKWHTIKTHLAQVVLGLFNKLLYPTAEDQAEWSDDERSEFNAFRHDVCDYLLSAYPILGVELVSVFQESATNCLQVGDWRGFEAAMFCLARLSEAVDENGHADQCLDAIFGSDAFSRLSAGGADDVPLKARQTMVDAFGKYESYFERRKPLLPGILNILFESLNFESCAQAASRSFLTLSKSCSRALTAELPVFLDQLDHFRTKPTATSSTMPKVLEGIAAIVQKLDSDEEKVQNLERMLTFFVQEANCAREEAAKLGQEFACIHGHLILSCIASIGRGLRSDADEVINIDSTAEQRNDDDHRSLFWSSGPGSHAQQLIMEAMRLLIVDFPVDNNMIDAACDILKAGYTERCGLFVFPPSLTVDFIQSFPLGISGTDVIMGTASSFLASHSSHSMRIRDEALALMRHVAQLFVSMLDQPELYDPETANACIDFYTRLVPKYYALLFSLTDPLPALPSDSAYQTSPAFAIPLHFALHALTRAEALPLRSAAAFWVTLIDLRGTSSEEIIALDQVLNPFISPLSQNLVHQISGQCARSDLAYLGDVLRRLLFKKQGLARPAIHHALAALESRNADDSGSSSSLPSAQEKSRFLESLIVARSARQQFIEIVRTFWLKCRGMSYDYAR